MLFRSIFVITFAYKCTVLGILLLPRLHCCYNAYNDTLCQLIYTYKCYFEKRQKLIIIVSPREAGSRKILSNSPMSCSTAPSPSAPLFTDKFFFPLLTFTVLLLKSNGYSIRWRNSKAILMVCFRALYLHFRNYI